MNIKSKIKSAIALASNAALLVCAKAAAAAVSVPDEHLVKTNADQAGVSSVVNSLINRALMVLGGVAVLLIVYGGYLIIFAGADEKGSFDKGKKIITYTIVGIIIIAIAAFIVKFALGVFGL